MSVTSSANSSTAAPPPAGNAGDQQERVSAFASLSRVMLLGFVRDRGTLFFTLALPLFFLVLFGSLYGSGGSKVHLKIAEIGQVQLLDSAENHAVIEKLATVSHYDDAGPALEKLRKGELDGVVSPGPAGGLVLQYSAADQTKSAGVQAVMNGLVQGANQQASGQPPKYRLEASQVEDKSLKPIQYLTPGLLSYAVAMGSVYGASFTLVGWRKKGILRRLRLAPISPGGIVAARVSVSVLVALVQTAIFLAVATTPYFGLKLTGNWWLVVPLVVVATIAFMSIGLVTGSLAKSEEAANGINQVIIMPMSFLGGAFFPLAIAPGWLQTVSHFLPLRYLVVSAQSVLSQGGGVMDVLPSMGGLLAFAAVLSAIAWRFFNWDDA